jgi:hypothetical protein
MNTTPNTVATETNVAAAVANLFEQASRKKLRFDNPNGGQLSVEDLWDLPLTSENKASLDKIAVALFRKLRDSQEMSFVTETTSSDTTTQLKFDIVRHVIETRKAENATKLEADGRAARKKELQQALAAARAGELANKTPAEIEAMLAAI